MNIDSAMSTGHRWRRSLAVAVNIGVLAIAACSKPASEQPPSKAMVVADQISIPELKLGPGDVVTPLPAGLPAAPADLHNLEGIWVGLGMPKTADGQLPPYVPAVLAERQRRMTMEKNGTPVVEKKSLCRPPGALSVSGNQFPTQIIQREDKLLFIAEEHRGVWPVYLNGKHPDELTLSYAGHNVAHWEGNTLVIETAGLLPKGAGFGADIQYSSKARITTRITRANTGDKQNGDRLVISRTIDDPETYLRPATMISVARWRPDMEMLEFNCEESTPAQTADGLVVQ